MRDECFYTAYEVWHKTLLTIVLLYMVLCMSVMFCNVSIFVSHPHCIKCMHCVLCSVGSQ